MPPRVVAICLWGGFGKRQGPITRRNVEQASKIKNAAFRNLNAVPKPLMPIATVPMSRISVEKLNAAGIDEIYATTHVLHDAIRAYYLGGPGKELGVKELWYENIPMGTAPGLIMNLMLRSSLMESTIVVPSGDIISDLDIKGILNAHHENKSLCTIALNPVSRKEVHRFGTADFKTIQGKFGSISAFKEKAPPSEAFGIQFENRTVYLNNSSFYVFSPELFLRPIEGDRSILEMVFPNIEGDFLKQIRSGSIDVKSEAEAKEHFYRFRERNDKSSDFGGHIFPKLAEKGMLRGFMFEEYWNDVGDNETYWFANWHALAKRFKMHIPYPEVEPGVWIGPGAEIIEGSDIIPPVIIGKNVKIEAGATIGPFAILDEGWTVEQGSEFVYSLTWPTFTTEGYQEGIPYQIIRRGTRIEKSLIAGRLPVGDHIFKGVIGDGSTIDHSRLVRTVVGIKIAMNSEIDVAKQTKRILVVDDEKPFRDIVVSNLKDAGWEFIETAGDLEEARQKLTSTRYDVVILDSILSLEQREESEGVVLLKEHKMREDSPNLETPVLFWSGHDSMDALRGLSPSDGLKLAERKTILRAKDKIAPRDLSDFIIEELLKI